jgi:hypothetical protein
MPPQQKHSPASSADHTEKSETQTRTPYRHLLFHQDITASSKRKALPQAGLFRYR